ncbi:siderophore-interacting protein [Orbaceae bacterium ESL0721]|nr:siderophore-interacting protein [Orbaceae bacterium ESL0721]
MKEHKKRVLINARLTVSDVKQISPNFIRICFTCDKPLTVNPLWIGPHLKLLFADPKTENLTFPEFDENNKINWKDGLRERVRTYSIRNYDADTYQLTVDFIIHQSGIATVWAQQAKIGDQIGLVNMGAKCQFNDANIKDQTLVLIGDDSALPTICYTLENLPKSTKAIAFIEVNNRENVIDFPNREQITIDWTIRESGNLSQLIEKVMKLTTLPNSEKLFFWGGMEGSLAQLLRNNLKNRYSELDKIQIISYWRAGFAEGQFPHRE